MKYVLNQDSLFEKHFEAISRIPHGSCNEEGVARYIEAFANEHGLWCYIDELFNVIVKKPGTPGYENSPALIMQAHTDMVCVQDEGRNHDFTKDPLELVLDGGILRARGTTLGADDILGVATILAIMEDPNAVHPPIEAVFTAQEEIGMIGASHLDYSLLSARRMIGMDSGGENLSTVNSAGGVDVRVKVPGQISDTAGSTWRMKIGGLKGGHSGVCIDMELGNAICIAARLLNALYEAGARLNIHSMTAGIVTNAIPSACDVMFCTDGDPEVIREKAKLIIADFYESEPDMSVSVEPVEAVSSAFDDESTRRLIRTLLIMPNGRARKGFATPAFITASDNIGIIETHDDGFLLRISVRGATEVKVDELLEKIAAVSDVLGLDMEIKGRYPCWEYNPQSYMRAVAAELMEKEWDKPLELEFVHGGVECGYFAGNLPGIDIFVIGPKADDVHTPYEYLDLESAERVYQFLLKYLALLKE